MRPLLKLSHEPVAWVILSLALVLSPHLSRLPFWIIILIPLLFVWRLAAIERPRLFPPKWILLILIILVSIATASHYGTLIGKTAGTAILTFLLAVKLLESRSNRDYMLLIALSFFIIVTNFLFSQSIPTVIFMLLTIVILVMSMIVINQQQAPLGIKARFRMASIMVLQGLPLMLVMFVLFPRIPGPIWHIPDDTNIARSGLSDSMSPGDISQLIQSNEVAFRVSFEQQPPARNQLYWRALVLWYFDGSRWEQGNTNQNPMPELEGLSTAIDYTVTLEPHDKKWLFALDMPVTAPANSRYTNDFLLRAKDNISSLHQYRLQSYIDYRIEKDLSIWEKSAGLKLPEQHNPRTLELGRRWRQQLGEPEAIIQHALQEFNQQDFRYSLTPPLTPGKHPVDQFLFETRKGFCEHYASSFTTLMRAAGIPARVIIGYQGGTKNPLNDYFSVRQSDAHAWSEVWLKDKGWIRIDPTAAIAPNRIERNLAAALPANESIPLHIQMNVGLIRQLRFYWDAIDNGWKQWVIGYDTQQQSELLKQLFGQDLSLSDLALMMLSAFFAVTLIVALFILKPFRKTETDPLQRLYQRFCNKLARHGMIRNSYEGPIDFGQRAEQQFPNQGLVIRRILRLYINLRYRSQTDPAQFSRLRQLIKALKLTQISGT
ncbi:MAG: transglutaminase TgpA family protein [Gammaproteobacteria bacterium]